MAKHIPEGILLIDKPKGPTSFDCVAQTRRLFHTKSVGHTGTLDPFATGLLVLLLGRYTRLCEYLTSQDKTYEAQVCLGVVTDTDDCEGRIISQADASNLTPELIQSVLESFLGEQLQVPPQYSAISLNGERAYKKARRGESVVYEPRRIYVYELSEVRHCEEPQATWQSYYLDCFSRQGGIAMTNLELLQNIHTYRYPL